MKYRFKKWFNQNVWSPSKPWLTHSGASVTIIINPCHWRFRPWLEDGSGYSLAEGPNYRGAVFGWLFVIIKVWIDDDAW